MLEQEGLSQISCSAASEQVAYFLVERAVLLGKLQVAARQLESHNIIDGLQFHREELEGKPAMPAGVVGDLEEAPQRLVESQADIQRVAEGLDTPSREQSGADRTELQRAMEHNSRLDKEILALRARVQMLDLERKAFLELGVETLHKRCCEAMENIEGRNSQLLYKLQKLEQEREGNEELESILGETQIQTKQEKQQLESEVEGLHQKITCLETELFEVQKNKSEMNGNEQVTSGAQEIQEMLESCQETIDKLGSQLGERRERRKQLASELELLWEDLKAEKVVLGSQGLSEERFQQQEEKLQQLRQDLRRVQNLCSSAERELRYEREKNTDLQRQNLLLQQECTKVKAELKQARAKLSDTTETCSSLSAQWERSQQKVKELELELSKCSQADKLQSNLQERLAQEKSRAGEAQKKVSKLQQKLKDSQHQLLLAEARVSDKKLLEEELKEARENEARVQQELHEEQLKRRLLEQQVEELRQQLRHSQETEASLAKMHVELQAKTLHVLEDEKKLDAGEHVQCQKENQKLSKQLALLKEENKALYEEGVRLLNQKDLYVRKYNEMQLRHKDKIRRAKETFIHEVKQRDSRIKQLENELSESKLQVEKGKVLIAQITAENEKLLQERRRLLQKISDQEESPWSLRSGIPSLQSRGKILEEENARLQDKLQLCSHVATSQRLARSSPAPNTEDSKIVPGSERQPQSKVLPPPRARYCGGEEEPGRSHLSILAAPLCAFTSQRPFLLIFADGMEKSDFQNILGNTGGFRNRCSGALEESLYKRCFPPRDVPEPLSALKAPQNTKPEGEAESQDSSFCLSPSQPSEIGYLNVASPGDSTAPTASPLQDSSLGSENF
ncbi:hypothetical protein IHE44_0007772 [Lamprotornis superbus]|uniref:Coiled-coil domain-containing protein 30 n=1 Tax=Lamprotornis superbus TaxID=245042 RepID=A0A835TU96_9PASS|nr:hypothetical protein IHE44_0007772 [Lamprotornis superbus]